MKQKLIIPVGMTSFALIDMMPMQEKIQQNIGLIKKCELDLPAEPTEYIEGVHLVHGKQSSGKSHYPRESVVAKLNLINGVVKNHHGMVVQPLFANLNHEVCKDDGAASQCRQDKAAENKACWGISQDCPA